MRRGRERTITTLKSGGCADMNKVIEEEEVE